MASIIEPMVRLGSDLLLASSRLTGATIGVVCNHASVDRGFLHVLDRVGATPGVRLGAIFGPQHGFRSDVQDNMVETPHVDVPAPEPRPQASGSQFPAIPLGKPASLA